MKTTKYNDTCEVEESKQSGMMDDLQTLRSDPHGSDELLDAVERLLDVEAVEIVDEILHQRWELPQAIEVEYASIVTRGKKKTNWTGAKQSKGW